MLTFNFNKYSLHKEGLMLDVGCGEGSPLVRIGVSTIID